MQRKPKFNDVARLAERRSQLARVASLRLFTAANEATALRLQNVAAEARRFANESKEELAEALKVMEGEA